AAGAGAGEWTPDAPRIAAGPSAARASRKAPSSWPRWAPSAPQPAASRQSSFTISGTPWARQRASSAVACSRRSAASAALLRYCSQAVEGSTGSTSASSRPVSATSGVIAYRPRAPRVRARSGKGIPPSRGEWDNAVLPTGPGTHYPMNDTPYRSWMCVVCGFIYDEAAGLPDDGIPPGTRWEDIPETWTCPDCGVTKDDFEMVAV